MAGLRLSWHDSGCGRRGPVKLFPGMFGVAPVPAKLQINLHRNFELHGFFAKSCHQFGLLARRHRAIEAIMHLEPRYDAFAPDGTHPQFSMSRRRSLNLCVERGVDVGAAQPPPVPWMFGVLPAAFGFFDSARTCAFGEYTGRLPQIPVTAGTIVEHGVADARGLFLDDGGEARDERQPGVVL